MNPRDTFLSTLHIHPPALANTGMGGQILGSGCPCGPVTRINGFRMRWTLLLTFLALLQGQD